MTDAAPDGHLDLDDAASAPDVGAAGADGTVLSEHLRRALEAILLVVEEPVEVAAVAEVLEASPADIVATLRALRREYVDAGRGFVLREVAGGWRYYTDPVVADYVEQFLLAGRSGRLSQAGLETLAIVAYKQPVTRTQISQIRGVDADAAVRSLVTRGLVHEVGRLDTPGQPLLYGTTPMFLERLGLRALDDLPPLPEVSPGGPLPPEPPLGGYKIARRELDALASVLGASAPAEVDERDELDELDESDSTDVTDLSNAQASAAPSAPDRFGWFGEPLEDGE